MSWYRTLRFGEPIVVVSGLPRAGTSMAMRMLAAGGMPIVSDGTRLPDSSNPHGYFEDERVKTLGRHADTSWLADARGKAIKIISFLLKDLPPAYNYRVIFMHRQIDEVVRSQRKMLTERGASDALSDERLARGYEDHLHSARRLLKHPCFESLHVEYADVLTRPLDEAQRMARFLKLTLDVPGMAAAVDRNLYRNRRAGKDSSF